MQTVATQQTQSQEKTSSSPDRSKEETQDKKGLLQLQRLIGNQVAQRITRAGTEKPTAPCCFDKTAFTIPKIQRKPTISSPDDPFEREADDVADTVMRMTDPGAVASAPVAIQRKCTECEDEEKIQTAPSTSTNTETEPDAELAACATEQSGRPLPREARDFFEPRFGRDFSRVRIHSDGHAATAARAVKSRAYTLGRDIVFNHGEYAPDTEGGKRLLAHELAHVVQQGHAQSGATLTQPMVQRQTEEPVADNNPVPTGPEDKKEPKGPMDDPEKPAPKDPDADCMGCKPLAKVTLKSGATTTIFGLCDDTFDVFNTGAGTPQQGPGCLPVSTNTTSMVNFRAGNPAWQTAAKIKDCTIPPPPTNSTTTPWEIGFIQTLESSTYGAKYDNNTFVKVTNKDARDALTATVAAPWYDDKGNSWGPQDYPTVPMINDTPNVSFRITHPGNAANLLRSVCMKAKFHLWLIINKKGTKPTAANVSFFYNWNIDLDQNYLLTGTGAHPCNISQWKAGGSISMSSKGPGMGSATPVWDQPIALSNSVTDTTATTDPCASSSATDAPKDKPKDPQSQ